MVCLACRSWGESPLCQPCLRLMSPGPTTRLLDGLTVTAAFVHRGTARRLVHRLKYQGVEPVAELLGRSMAALLPEGVEALVPVPRTLLRRIRFGVDPGETLARVIGREAGLPMIRALRSPLWQPPHAGRPRAKRSPPLFEVVRSIPAGSLLVDDVLTTGGTLRAARAVLGGPDRAITATMAIQSLQPAPV